MWVCDEHEQWAIEHILNLWYSFELRLHWIRWGISSSPFFHAFLCSNFALHCVSVSFFLLLFLVLFSFCLIFDLYFCDFKLWTDFSKFHYSCVTNFSCLFFSRKFLIFYFHVTTCYRSNGIHSTCTQLHVADFRSNSKGKKRRRNMYKIRNIKLFSYDQYRENDQCGIVNNPKTFEIQNDLLFEWLSYCVSFKYDSNLSENWKDSKLIHHSFLMI